MPYTPLMTPSTASRFNTPWTPPAQEADAFTEWWNPNTRQYASNPTGTGSQFLAGLEIGNIALGDPNIGRRADPFGGKARDFRAIPVQSGLFLRGELGPGGSLSGAAQNRRVAQGVRQITEGGRLNKQQLIDALVSSGVNPSQALRSSLGVDVQTRGQTFDFLQQAQAELEQRRFDEIKDYLQSVAATALAQKQASQARKLARQGAEAAVEGAALGAAGELGGALIGGL